MKATNSELLGLLAGELDVHTLAARHGVSAEVVADWRAAFVAGLQVAERAGRRRTRWGRWLVVSALVATVAFAQSLTPMLANRPAVAADVNGNFNLLKQWLEAKVGAVGTNLAPGTGNISTSGSLLAGSLNTGGNVTASGTVSGNTVSATSVTASGSVSAGGEVRLGGSGYAPRADESLRVIRGTVTAANPNGVGYTSTGGGTSTQNITFAAGSFSAPPTVLCTVSGSPSTDACSLVTVTANGFTSWTGTRNVQFTNANITFIAIGPR